MRYIKKWNVLLWWHMPVIPALWMLRQDDFHEFKFSLGYLVISRPACTSYGNKMKNKSNITKIPTECLSPTHPAIWHMDTKQWQREKVQIWWLLGWPQRSLQNKRPCFPKLMVFICVKDTGRGQGTMHTERNFVAIPGTEAYP